MYTNSVNCSLLGWKKINKDHDKHNDKSAVSDIASQVEPEKQPFQKNKPALFDELVKDLIYINRSYNNSHLIKYIEYTVLIRCQVNY